MEQSVEYFPSGAAVEPWFYDTTVPGPDSFGKKYIVTEHGVRPDGKIYTKELQKLIDDISENGGGLLVIPQGIFMSGALFLKKGVSLYVEKGGVLMGSDDINDYPLCDTRIEGENCLYHPALINADGVDGFVMCGQGTIDGNGLRSWKAFWELRAKKPDCTNKEVERARLVYISNSSNVTVAGLTLQNSQFWTDHVYKCDHVRFLGCRILSPAEPVKAPSTDAIDIDGCSYVLIKNCYMAVNDDAVALKGGKGPYADTAPENAANERIIIEDCEYGFCHGALTCGSESIRNNDVIVRRVEVKGCCNLLWLKMRPDTPQIYENIAIREIKGRVNSFLNINPWTQFFDLKGRKDIPRSYASHIEMTDCDCDADVFMNVHTDDTQYVLSDIRLKNVRVAAGEKGYPLNDMPFVNTENVRVTVTEHKDRIKSAVSPD